MSQIAQELRSPLRSRELIQRTSGIAQKLIPASTNPSCEAPRANRQCSNIKDIFAPIHSQALSRTGGNYVLIFVKNQAMANNKKPPAIGAARLGGARLKILAMPGRCH